MVNRLPASFVSDIAISSFGIIQQLIVMRQSFHKLTHGLNIVFINAGRPTPFVASIFHFTITILKLLDPIHLVSLTVA